MFKVSLIGHLQIKNYHLFSTQPSIFFLINFKVIMALRTCIIVLMLFVGKNLHSQLQINPLVGLDCLTGKGTISVQVTSGTPPYTFTWSPAVSVNSLATNLNTGVYNFTVVDAANNIGVSQVIINLTVLMDINFNLPGTTSVTCFGGSNGAISATVTGNAVQPPFTYTWSTGSNNPAISNLSAGVYTLSATDSKGCTKTSTFQVAQPSQIVSSINASLSCYNVPITTSITTSGGIGPYSYTVDGVPVTGNVVNNLSAGSHTIITKDANNCFKTDIVLINQPPVPVFNFSVTPPTCPTSSNGVVSVTVGNLSTPLNYTWTPGFSSGQSITSIPQGVYTVSVKDAKNCLTNATVQVIPQSNIQTTVLVKPETCSAADGGATVQVIGGALPYSFQFNTNAPQASNVSNTLSTGVQTVVVKDAISCSLVTTFSVGNTSLVQLTILSQKDVKCFEACDGELILSVSNAVPPVSYSLTGFPLFSTSTITGICSGTYVVRATDNVGCYASATVSYSTPPSYSFSAIGNTLICSGKTAVLQSSVSGGTGPYTYSWQPGNLSSPSVSVSPITTTVYSLQVIDANGCTKPPSTVSVNVYAPLTVSVSQQNTGICPGTTAQITPSVSGGDGNYTYLWLPGNNTGPSIFISNLTNPTYTFLVNDGCGGPPLQQIINLQIFPVTIPTFAADTLFGCQPLCVKFSNTTPGSSNPVWNFGDQPFELIGSNPEYCYQKNGKYNVKLSITDQNGCRFSATKNNFIEVFVKPKASFISNPAIITDNIGEAELRSSSLNANQVSWFVDNSFKGNNPSVSLLFNDTVCFNVRLYAYTEKGCSDSIASEVCVKPGFTFYVPSAFTPDGDELNETFYPRGQAWDIESYRFYVYNRWGEQLFYSTKVGEGWNGKVKDSGGVCKDGIYVWTVQLKDVYGNEHNLKGHFILIK